MWYVIFLSFLSGRDQLFLGSRLAVEEAGGIAQKSHHSQNEEPSFLLRRAIRSSRRGYSIARL